MTYGIRADARSGASARDAFALLADGSSWLQWGAWTGFDLAVPDPGGGQGVGPATSA